jgi:hypothetical protein
VHLHFNPKPIPHLYMKWFTSYHEARGCYEQILCPCQATLWSALMHIWHIKFQTLDSGTGVTCTHAHMRSLHGCKVGITNGRKLIKFGSALQC